MKNLSHRPEPEARALLTLAMFVSFGAKRLGRILTHLSPEEGANASALELVGAGIEPDIAQQFVLWRNSVTINEQYALLEREAIAMLTTNDKEYPPLLRHTATPPAILFVKGSLPEDHRPTVAVVGTRSLTAYGKAVTPPLVDGLVAAEVVIVSGLALGVDSIAHQTTVEKRGTTIAVVANGIDRASTYPTLHRNLTDAILDSGGAVISEFPPGTLPLRHYFPLRNRIIAGLAHATLVVEADEQSGALITARAALEENRDVFAVPGSILSAQSRGTNQLIALGAICCMSSETIIERLPIKTTVPASVISPQPAIDSTEQTILHALQAEGTAHRDDIIRRTGLTSDIVQTTLTIMEMKGWVRDLGTGTFASAIRASQ